MVVQIVLKLQAPILHRAATRTQAPCHVHHVLQVLTPLPCSLPDPPTHHACISAGLLQELAGWLWLHLSYRRVVSR